MTSPTTRPIRRDTKTPISSEPSFANIPVDAVKYQVTVRYPGRLRPHRVETVTVSVAPLQAVDPVLDVGRKPTMDPIPIRLVIPGAVLLPAEQSLTPTPFGAAEAMFYVTAVAEGELPDCRVELFRHGKLEAVPLPLRSEGHRSIVWMSLVTVLVPLLVFLPTCWPGLAENADVQRAVSGWFPAAPSAIGKTVLAVYDFLAHAGHQLSLSFFTFLALLGWTTVWAVARRPTVGSACNDPFLLTPAPAPHTNGGPLHPLLMPASTDDVGDLRR